MRSLIVIISSVIAVYASILNPHIIIQAGGNVQSIVVNEKRVIVGTNAGSVEVYSLETGALSDKIVFESIRDFTGESIAPKVFSVDVLGEEYVVTLQASSGARSLVLVEKGKKIRTLIDAKENLFITKAAFIDKNRIVLALMSNELVLLDRNSSAKLYQTQINPSHFSDFALNETRSLLVSSCESGEITLSDVFSGKTLHVFSGGNVDNVYKVDFKKNKILATGQDRRGIIYDTKTKGFDRYDASFLLYAGGLSPSASKAALAFNEENDIIVFDTVSKQALHTLRGQRSTLNSIVFSSENELVSGSDDAFIMIWRIP